MVGGVRDAEGFVFQSTLRHEEIGLPGTGEGLPDHCEVEVERRQNVNV